ncbi:hypothetical protein A2917_03485 [Candidatus Nomurabacteria bacterium RIFCSPLOWO2_01_FULL_42_17]|uniref:HD domain-containing protein n=1 Tax=Candidatus Nomurabacteria bacterium RIFCSPLOWO2_01_FULL_42_17 TaxID=1801780 RepID=A0A1F6XN83_9BACT|nr:MAG: hypothetical protein A2917_03485 [Candidatus Nomurabacteria bacterium RIFCSPLOWO2_01_FULL_42_17]
MKKISEIYTEYKIMPNLQEHMLRVAAVASLICDNFNEPVSKAELVTACLLHDMGNIIKSQLEYFPEFLEPEGLEYWQGVKNEYINKYGRDEHKATEQIMKELGVFPNLISVVDQIRFSLIRNIRDSNDMMMKIIIYSDNRADPHGIVSYEERMEEGKKRYKNRKDVFGITGRDELIQCGKEIEKQIFSKCKIKPEDINNETVAPIVLKLKNFVVK